MNIETIKIKRIFQLTKDEVNYLYNTLGYSQTKIAKLLNTDAGNVSRKFKKDGIIASNKNKLISNYQCGSNIEITKDILLMEYPQNTVTTIAKKYKVSSSYIYNLLIKNKIPIIKMGEFQKLTFLKPELNQLTKEILYKLYITDKTPMYKIGELYNVDKNYIKRRLIENNIKVRSKKEAFNTNDHKNLKRNILLDKLNNNLAGFIPMYNKKSIKIIEEFGIANGFNFKHAENGGEFIVNGTTYWVDGYDELNNVVVEFYENSHKYRKDYDDKRILAIKNKLKCKIFIIHENGEIEPK